jgi:hypothetical protein
MDRLTVNTGEGAQERELPRQNLSRRGVQTFAGEVAGTRTPVATGQGSLRLARVAHAGGGTAERARVRPGCLRRRPQPRPPPDLPNPIGYFCFGPSRGAKGENSPSVR